MGEVYKGRDTRLDRTVALKVLPGHIAHDPALRERLEREARVISSLDHPRICALYDIGHQNGIDFLVMQFLDGETLAERLARGALPMDLTFKYAIEIAEALDVAHRAGIIHRDLKPGNVMLTESGAKLLDFGVAKLKVSRDHEPDQLTRLGGSATATGTVLGTTSYMAPEQIEGRDAGCLRARPRIRRTPMRSCRCHTPTWWIFRLETTPSVAWQATRDHLGSR
jgi:serine/threonine protein kinase